LTPEKHKFTTNHKIYINQQFQTKITKKLMRYYNQNNQKAKLEIKKPKPPKQSKQPNQPRQHKQT